MYTYVVSPTKHKLIKVAKFLAELCFVVEQVINFDLTSLNLEY